MYQDICHGTYVENPSFLNAHPGELSQLYQSTEAVNRQSATALLNIANNLSHYASSLQAYHSQFLTNNQNQYQKHPKQNGKRRKKNKHRKSQKTNWDYEHPIPEQTCQSLEYIKSAATRQNLLLERIYLFSSLQHEDQRATDILSQVQVIQQYLELPFNNIHDHKDGEIPYIDGLLTQPFPQVKKRKLVRQLHHLKNRLSEITQQEKRMLARLEQVTNEIHRRETPQIVIEEESWGFPDATNLHSYGCGFGGVGGLNGSGGFATIPVDPNKLKVDVGGNETPASGVSPRAQSPETASRSTVLDPRSPVFEPRSNVNARRFSVIDWAEPQYKNIMEEVQKQQVQVKASVDEPLVSPPAPPPSFSNPSLNKRASVINWSEPQYKHILDEVQEVREQREDKTRMKWVEGRKTVKICEAPQNVSIQTTIIDIDSPEHTSFPPPKLESICTEDGVSKLSKPTNKSNANQSEEQTSHELDHKSTLFHENYQIGLAKIRAASVSIAPKQIIDSNSESDENNETENRDIPIPTLSTSWSEELETPLTQSWAGET